MGAKVQAEARDTTCLSMRHVTSRDRPPPTTRPTRSTVISTWSFRSTVPYMEYVHPARCAPASPATAAWAACWAVADSHMPCTRGASMPATLAAA